MTALRERMIEDMRIRNLARNTRTFPRPVKRARLFELHSKARHSRSGSRPRQLQNVTSLPIVSTTT